MTKIAVVGCGGWGKNIVRSLEGLGRDVVELAAVVDPTEAGQARARELAPGAAIHDTLEPVLDDASIDGVMIATPAETHHEVATRCLEAGKHVFVEKPLTTELADARDLVDRAGRLGRVLMTGHLLEYHPSVLALKQLIDDGELGQVRYVISHRLNLGKVRTEENALWSFAPHDIAVILRLVGHEPIQVVATGGAYVSPNIADVSVTQLLFANGVRAHVFVSWLHPFKEQKLVVVGSKRMAVFDDIEKTLVLHDQRVEWQQGQPVPVKGDGLEVEVPKAEPLKEECRHFVEAIEARRHPRTCGVEGLRVLQVLHAAQQSLTMNGQPVVPAIEAAPRGGAMPAPAAGAVEVEVTPAAAAVASANGTRHARV